MYPNTATVGLSVKPVLDSKTLNLNLLLQCYCPKKLRVCAKKLKVKIQI